jgi:hypothetical protein
MIRAYSIIAEDGTSFVTEGIYLWFTSTVKPQFQWDCPNGIAPIELPQWNCPNGIVVSTKDCSPAA